MTEITPPVIQCSRIAGFELDNMASIRQALEGADKVELREAWLPERSDYFQPAVVSTGWTADALIVWARLTDLDIFNEVREFNQWAFNKGDAFEIFLRPCQQPAYFEFHLTPFNQLLQLRFPSAEKFRAMTKVPGWDDECLVYEPRLESRATIAAEENRWEVVAAIPFSLVVEEGKVEDGSQWLFSFSRYDHTRGLSEPTLSSSSPHGVCNFHRQEEWGTLTFREN